MSSVELKTSKAIKRRSGMPRLSHCRRRRRTSRCFDDTCISLVIRGAARCLTSSRIGAAHPAKCAGTDSIFRYGRTCATEKRRTLTPCSTHCRCCLAPQSLAARSHPPRRADGRGYSSTRDCVGRTEEGTRVLRTASGGRKRVLEYSRLRRADGKAALPDRRMFRKHSGAASGLDRDRTARGAARATARRLTSKHREAV